MSQYDFGNLESPVSGTTFFNTHLEPWRNAVHSSHKGSSRPSYAQAGIIWVDDNTTPWVVKFFDGTDDITIGTVNATTNTFIPSGVIFNNTSATSAPTVNEDSGDGYSAGSIWVNLTTDLIYQCVDASVGAAIWKQLVDTNSTQALTGKSFASITVTGGSITGITDLSVADGGTGASDAGAARANLGVFNSQIAGGRLTLTTGVPITTTDVTSASTLYYTPLTDNRISLYDGSGWWTYTFSEISLALSGLTSGRPYDAFIYTNAGVATLEILAWTNDTTRATALTRQDGVLVKNGDATRRYVGTFYTTSTNTTEDSRAKRYVWNYYNRRSRKARVVDTTDTWNYSTASYRQANGSTANQIEMVIGVQEDIIHAWVQAYAINSTSTIRQVNSAMGLDNTTALTETANNVGITNTGPIGIPSAFFDDYVGVGRHYLTWLERGGGADTQTWSGDNGGTAVQSGIHAIIWG